MKWWEAIFGTINIDTDKIIEEQQIAFDVKRMLEKSSLQGLVVDTKIRPFENFEKHAGEIAYSVFLEIYIHSTTVPLFFEIDDVRLISHAITSREKRYLVRYFGKRRYLVGNSTPNWDDLYIQNPKDGPELICFDHGLGKRYGMPYVKAMNRDQSEVPREWYDPWTLRWRDNQYEYLYREMNHE